MQNLRLFLPVQITNTSKIQLTKLDIHYLLNVMKVRNQEAINVFNERDGEWVSQVHILSKDNVFLFPIKNIKKPTIASKIILAFALLKRQNNNLIVQKATELNVREICPIVTERTIVRTTNIEKFKLVAKEATEQCGRFDIPKIHPTSTIDELVKKNKQRSIILCNNQQESEHIFKLQRKLDCEKDSIVLVGPEGGFSETELKHFGSLENVFNVNLGALTLRAETAVIASLFSVQMMYDLSR